MNQCSTLVNKVNLSDWNQGASLSVNSNFGPLTICIMGTKLHESIYVASDHKKHNMTSVTSSITAWGSHELSCESTENSQKKNVTAVSGTEYFLMTCDLDGFYRMQSPVGCVFFCTRHDLCHPWFEPFQGVLLHAVHSLSHLVSCHLSIVEKMCNVKVLWWHLCHYVKTIHWWLIWDFCRQRLAPFKNPDIVGNLALTPPGGTPATVHIYKPTNSNSLNIKQSLFFCFADWWCKLTTCLKTEAESSLTYSSCGSL